MLDVRCSPSHVQTRMTNDLSAEEVGALLKLEPHATCGFVIPGNTFHTARVIGQRRWFVGASTEWPGVEKVDIEIGDVEALATKYPDVADNLRAFQKGSGD